MHLRLLSSPHFSSAKTWITGVLLQDLLGISVEMNFQEGTEGYVLELPNGRQVILEDHFFRLNQESDFLSTAQLPETPIRLSPPFESKEEVVALYGRPHLEIGEQRIRCGLDLWASAFFMLSRWEEYGKEQHGRFPAASAFVVRHELLRRPLVHEYAALLRDFLAASGLTVPYPRQAARLHLSCDVDHPRLWRRPADRLRTLAGSMLRRFNPAELGYWLTGPVWGQKDPFDVFDEWMRTAAAGNLQWHFNFLAGRAAAPDCDYDLDDPFVRDLFRRIHDGGHEIGFHPSRAAATDARQFEKELVTLRAYAPGPVLSGRQHYLHFKTPDTWRLWADAGMQWDSSLGYAEQEGFRCGMAQSFPVFDCERQQVLPIREKPLIAMDVTLAKYRRLQPGRAFESLQQLGVETKKHGGEMVLLWHNSSWNTYFWAPWKEVLLQYAHSW